jgi:hypothetical protein
MSTALAVSAGNDVQDVQIVEAEYEMMPSMVVSLDDYARGLSDLKRFISSQMVNGTDYGVIPGTGSKPALLKPGAEKINAIFGLAPRYEHLEKVDDWEEGFFYRETKCVLISKRSGAVVAEGIGSCSTRERKYKNQTGADVHNTIVKMACKRAMVAATLAATRASGLFDENASTDAVMDEGKVEARITQAETRAAYEELHHVAQLLGLRSNRGEDFPALPDNLKPDVYAKGCAAIRRALEAMTGDGERTEPGTESSAVPEAVEGVPPVQAVPSTPKTQVEFQGDVSSNGKTAPPVLLDKEADARDLNARVHENVENAGKKKGGARQEAMQRYLKALEPKGFPVLDGDALLDFTQMLVERLGHPRPESLSNIATGVWVLLADEAESGRADEEIQSYGA